MELLNIIVLSISQMFMVMLLVLATIYFMAILGHVFNLFGIAVREFSTEMENTKRQQEKDNEEQPERVLSPMEQKIRERADMLIYQENKND